MKYTWQRYGGYECSSKGDKRFSAFNARLSDGRTIEEHYQCDIKGYDVGGTNWRLGKGKPPLNPMSKEALYHEYMQLWYHWIKANEALFRELKTLADQHDGVLSDRFASGEVNQARALSDFLNHFFN